VNYSANTLPYHVIEALKQGQTIEAIKRLRDATGLGLKEAKEAIDAYQNDNDARLPDADEFSAPMVEALQSGNKLEAIRLLHAQGKHDLRQAKQVVDAYLEEDFSYSESAQTNHQVPEDLLQALHAGEKLLSIKLLREQTGLGLKEAKDIVEALPLQNDQRIKVLQDLYLRAQNNAVNVSRKDEFVKHEKISEANHVGQHSPTIQKPRSNAMIAWFIGIALLAFALYYLLQG
jgi:ribosomal protein L7/L12